MKHIKLFENFATQTNNIPINSPSVVLSMSSQNGSIIAKIFPNPKLAENAYYFLMARRIELGCLQNEIGNKKTNHEKQLIQKLQEIKDYLLVKYDKYNNDEIPKVKEATEIESLISAKIIYKSENQKPINVTASLVSLDKDNEKLFDLAIPISTKHWTLIDYNAKIYNIQDIDLYKNPFEISFLPTMSTKIRFINPNWVNI